MQLSTILSHKGKEVYNIARDKTLKDVVAEMLTLKIGSLLILNEDGSIAGIITERDVLHYVDKHPRDWDNVLVSVMMQTNVFVCPLDKTIVEAKEILAEHHIRHLPIVDSGKVVGLISIRDVVYASLEESAFQNKLLKRYINDWPEGEEEEAT